MRLEGVALKYFRAVFVGNAVAISVSLSGFWLLEQGFYRIKLCNLVKILLNFEALPDP